MSVNTYSDYTRSINKSVNLFCQGNSEGAFKVLGKICSDKELIIEIEKLFNRFQKNKTTEKPELGTTTEPQLAKQIETILCGEEVAEPVNEQPTCNALAITNCTQNNIQFLINTDRCPLDIFIEVFSNLSISELGICSQVCHAWQIIINNDGVWNKLVTQIFKNGCGAKNCQNLIREFYSKHLKSNDEILTSLKAFVKKVTLGHNARFRCILQLGAHYQELIVIIKADRERSGSPLYITNFDYTEDYFALNPIGDGSVTIPEDEDEDINRFRCNGTFSVERDDQGTPLYYRCDCSRANMTADLIITHTDQQMWALRERMEHTIGVKMYHLRDELEKLDEKALQRFFITMACLVFFVAYLAEPYIWWESEK